MQDFKRLNATGTTIVLITHDEDVARQASRCLRMVDGRLEEVHFEDAESSTAPQHNMSERQQKKQPLERSGVRAWFSSVWDAAAAMTTRLGRSALLCTAFFPLKKPGRFPKNSRRLTGLPLSDTARASPVMSQSSRLTYRFPSIK